jgi:hypothetical protein
MRCVPAIPLPRTVGLFMALLASFTVDLGAQVRPQEIQARTRYVEAQQLFETLQAEAFELQPRVARVAATLEGHRRMGNQRATEDVFVNEYYALALRLQRVDVRSREAKIMLDEARRDLLRILRDREDAYLQELSRGTTRVREADINRQIVRIRQEVSQLERERQPIAEVGFRPVPPLEAAPTDGPVELRVKAGFLERIAGDYIALLSFLDEEIQVRERSLRLQRGFQDTRDGIGRFDGDRPPATGAASRPPGRDEASETRGADPAFYDLPLSEQIESLRSVRTQAEEARDEALDRAAELRRLATVRGGPGGVGS